MAGLSDEAFERPSGCAGWLVRDLVCHLVIDAQDVLITLATPTDAEPTRDAVTCWEVVDTPAGDDPLSALTVRLAAAYGEPELLVFHLDDVGSAAGRAARLADPACRVATKDQVLTVGDYLSAYVLEWTLHHLDLVTHLPGVAGPAPTRSPTPGRRRMRSPEPRSPRPSPTPTRCGSARGDGPRPRPSGTRSARGRRRSRSS